jgi:hypothetical protein
MSFLRIQDHLIDVDSISFIELDGEEKRSIAVYFKTEYDNNTRPDTDLCKNARSYSYLCKNARSYSYSDAKTAQEDFERISGILDIDREHVLYHVVEQHTGKCVEKQMNENKKQSTSLDKMMEESDKMLQDYIGKTRKWLDEQKAKQEERRAKQEEERKAKQEKKEEVTVDATGHSETPRVHEQGTQNKR